MGLNPKKLNLLLKSLINYKKIFNLFKTKSVISDKYKKEIKEHFEEDNLELINNFEKIKKYQSFYSFKI